MTWRTRFMLEDVLLPEASPPKSLRIVADFDQKRRKRIYRWWDEAEEEREQVETSHALSHRLRPSALLDGNWKSEGLTSEKTSMHAGGSRTSRPRPSKQHLLYEVS